MALFKCKMCGGDLEINPGVTVAECEYCGTKQTLPKANEEVVQNLFNRANALRLKCEFDKAEQIYEKILHEDDTEAEAHWGIVLCKYGIEYVEDPKTYKRIPTCHRTSYDAVTTDVDYLAAIQHADIAQKSIYEAEAKTIDEIQRGILSIVKEEKPFDVFICYKESDEYGKRTIDSAIANDIYHQLTQEGLKVFYAAITLEDKLGRAYEPYIFAALNSAKVMLVIGTKPQYFTAVWVKNEWGRFMKLMKADRSKLLIPCYKDMDAYELPEEFAHLQAQDMSKIGFINDVVRGIKKITVKDEPKAAVAKETVVTGGNANAAPLLKRAFMFLEDGEWARADEFCEQVLNIDPECAQAYLGKLMAELQVKKQEDLKRCAEPFDSKNNYQKALRFADETLSAFLSNTITTINDRILGKAREKAYKSSISIFKSAITEQDFLNGMKILDDLGDYKDAKALKAEQEKAWLSRKETAAKIWKDYCAGNDKFRTVEDEIAKETSLIEETKINIAKAKARLEEIDKKTKQLAFLEEQLHSLQRQIAQANDELSSVGFFSFAKKKDLSVKIESLTADKAICAEKIKQLKNSINKAESSASLLSAIESKKRIITEAQSKLDSLQSESRSLKTQLAPVIEKLRNRQIIACLANDENILPLLIEEHAVAATIKADDELRYMIKSSEAFSMLPDRVQKRVFGVSSLDSAAVYYQACQAMQNARSMEDIRWARDEFLAIRHYKDSADLLETCEDMISRGTYKLAKK